MVRVSRERAAHSRGATSEALASRQETSVQNPNPSQNPFSYPSLLQELLERTFFGARPASAGAAPTPGDILGSEAARGDDPADEDTGIGDDPADDTGDPGEPADRLELAELLGVMRDPIEWVFTLAERRAQADPVDIAAIHRVRDAVLHRMNAIIVDAVSAESPRIRSADLLTVGSLLFDAIDPSLVQRVTRGIRTSLSDALNAMLEVELAGHVAAAAAPVPGQDIPPSVPPWYASAVPVRPMTPFGYGAPWPYAPVPYGAPCVGPFAAPHALRPTVPPWSNPFPFGF
jgi:hypothetical protein